MDFAIIHNAYNLLGEKMTELLKVFDALGIQYDLSVEDGEIRISGKRHFYINGQGQVCVNWIDTIMKKYTHRVDTKDSLGRAEMAFFFYGEELVGYSGYEI